MEDADEEEWIWDESMHIGKGELAKRRLGEWARRLVGGGDVNGDGEAVVRMEIVRVSDGCKVCRREGDGRWRERESEDRDARAERVRARGGMNVGMVADARSGVGVGVR